MIDRAGVPIRVGGRSFRGAVQIVFIETKVFERRGRSQVFCKPEKTSPGGALENIAYGREQFWHTSRIEPDGMRQHHGVGFSVGQMERSAQRVTNLVVQRHSHLPENGATQPSQPGTQYAD